MTAPPLIADIQAATCRAFGIPLLEMQSDRRSQAVARPRQLAMFLSHRLTHNSLPAIGRKFGNRDHSTVIHAIKRVSERLASDEDLRKTAALIERAAKRRARRRSAEVVASGGAMIDLPEPLTPVDCDLRGLPFMPMDTIRALDSDLFGMSSGEEFKAAFALWCKSWQQIPAGSLPDDDKMLAYLSGAGPRWRKLKSMALRNWIKCRDGRLYHPVVAEKALEALPMRQEYKDKKTGEADRKAREREDRRRMFDQLRAAGVTPEYNTKTSELRALVTQHVTENVTKKVTPVTRTVTAKTGTGTGTGKDKVEEPVADATGAEAAPLSPATIADPTKIMFDHGLDLLAAAGTTEARARPMLGRWRSQYGAEAVIVALGNAKREGAIDPVSFIEKCLKNGGRNGSGPDREGQPTKNRDIDLALDQLGFGGR